MGVSLPQARLSAGCESAGLSDNLQPLAVEFATEKANQTALWLWALNAAGGKLACPYIDIGKLYRLLHLQMTTIAFTGYVSCRWLVLARIYHLVEHACTSKQIQN